MSAASTSTSWRKAGCGSCSRDSGFSTITKGTPDASMESTGGTATPTSFANDRNNHPRSHTLPVGSQTMQNVLAIILGGGRGERLYPLTKHRAKPALPLAGKYRLIDIPVSNCINSGLLKIYVLTQFN